MKTAKFKSVKAIAIASIVAFGVTACNGTPLITNTSADPQASQGNPSFAQFTDIPVPDGAVMDVRQTLVLGSQDSWIGRLVVVAGYIPTSMFDFFKVEMPKFGWQEITTVRSAISVLTYRRGTRIATIQIQTGGLQTTSLISGSEVHITVSPEGSSVNNGVPQPQPAM